MMCYGVEKPKIAEKAVGSSFLLFLLCHQGTCIGHLSYFLSQIVVSVLLLLKYIHLCNKWKHLPIANDSK